MKMFKTSDSYGHWEYRSQPTTQNLIYSTRPDPSDPIVDQAFKNWTGLISTALGAPWEELENAMALLGISEYPEHWVGLGESMMFCDGHELT